MKRLSFAFASFSLVAALSFAIQGCGGNPDDSSSGAAQDLSKSAAAAVQMNDISILYPLAKTEADFSSYLDPTSQGVGGDLLPADLFSAVSTQVQGVNGQIDITKLRAVAFRLDPCFAQIGTLTDPSQCSHQLRIVYQPLTASTSGKSVTADDAGVHAFYSLTADQFEALLEGVIALRKANATTADLGPLAIHPIIAKQGLSGAMASGLNSLFLQYAGKASLTRVTAFLGVFAQHTSWNFAAVDIEKGVAKPSEIPGLAPKTMTESVNLGTAPTGLISLGFDAVTAMDVVAPLLTATVQDATADARQAAFDSALRIENPDFNSPNTIDCASCHTAQIARQLVGEDFFKLSEAGDANTFVADANFVSAKDARAKYAATQPNGLSANLHAFSYDGTQPMIIQRVVNETAAIVAELSAGPLATK